MMSIQPIVLQNNGFKLTFSFDRMIHETVGPEQRYLDTIIQLQLSTDSSQYVITASKHLISSRDLSHLSAYLQEYRQRLNDKTPEDSDVFVDLNLSFQLQFLDGCADVYANGTRVGTLPDGRQVNLRRTSSDENSVATIEVMGNRRIKFRYIGQTNE